MQLCIPFDLWILLHMTDLQAPCSLYGNIFCIHSIWYSKTTACSGYADGRVWGRLPLSYLQKLPIKQRLPMIPRALTPRWETQRLKIPRVFSSIHYRSSASCLNHFQCACQFPDHNLLLSYFANLELYLHVY